MYLSACEYLKNQLDFLNNKKDKSHIILLNQKTKKLENQTLVLHITLYNLLQEKQSIAYDIE